MSFGLLLILGLNERFFTAALGNKKAKALLAFHALTGCDTVVAFAGRGKRR